MSKAFPRLFLLLFLLYTCVGAAAQTQHVYPALDSPNVWTGPNNFTNGIQINGAPIPGTVTGSGAMVLATAPTLINPVLGVASGTSLVLGGGSALTTTNQTGTGSLVMSSGATLTNPTMTTPTLGVATATSINGLTIASSTGTLTIGNLKSFNVSNSLILVGSDGATITFQGSDTYVGRATTDTFSNKTFDTASSNVLRVNGNLLSATAGSATVTLPNSTDTLVGKATTDTLTNKTLTSPTVTSPTTTGTDSGTETMSNKTLTSPIVNGTPSGTGIPTVVLKTGSAGGNYTTSSTSYVDVDATNLKYIVTIPVGWKLVISTSGETWTSTGAAIVGVSLSDSGTLIETGMGTAGAGNGFTETFALNWVINGDGASHTVKLQFKTLNGADAANMGNSGSTVPQMVFTLTPSN